MIFIESIESIVLHARSRGEDLFWDAEDVVIQYHPAKSEDVNNHDYCLHVWPPVEQEIPTPKELVGY